MKNKMVTIGGIEFDLKLTFLIVYSTFVPMLDYYNHRITGTKAYDRFIFYFIIPMLIILFVMREPPQNFGFQLGNWRAGLLWVLVSCVGMGIILWFVSRTSGMQQYYSARAPSSVGRLLFLNGVELFAWEFMWRGLLLFAYARYFGPGAAIFLQAVPFAFMHLGKPEVETLSTIFGGAAFGFIAWQTQSFVYPWIIHWFIASFTTLIATGRF
ncbi:MAG: CPBP family intramembrane metalloprotease [Anaerolineaceae bacterium]|nr:MAG: CPBP family intramembrane metalloprotease [Anaerolineaceae bacterium]